ncbi:MAG: hypothetical protein CM15mP38_0010 [Synechococcus sp.]|nr:MAG: hypothetical protein CM15mP38_0010 [Synechococcus sp.]
MADGPHYAQNSAQNFIFDIGQALTGRTPGGKGPSGADTRIRAIRRGEGYQGHPCPKTASRSLAGKSKAATSTPSRMVVAIPPQHRTALVCSPSGTTRPLGEQMDLPARWGCLTHLRPFRGKSLQSMGVGADRVVGGALDAGDQYAGAILLKGPSRCSLPGAFGIRKEARLVLKPPPSPATVHSRLFEGSPPGTPASLQKPFIQTTDAGAAGHRLRENPSPTGPGPGITRWIGWPGGQGACGRWLGLDGSGKSPKPQPNGWDPTRSSVWR